MQEMELFNTILKSNPGITIDSAMEMYRSMLEKFYQVTNEVKYSFATSSQSLPHDNVIDVKPLIADFLCGYKKEDLKVKPENSIQNDFVYCCICGAKQKSLTMKHIAKHNNLTREGYLELCGFKPSQKLVCTSMIEKRREQINKNRIWEKTKKSKEQSAKKSENADAKKDKTAKSAKQKDDDKVKPIK